MAENLNSLEKEDLFKLLKELMRRLAIVEAEILRLRKLIQGL